MNYEANSYQNPTLATQKIKIEGGDDLFPLKTIV